MSPNDIAPQAQQIVAALRARARGRRRRLVLEGESIAGAEYRVAAERLLGRGLEPEELAAILLAVEPLGPPPEGPPAPEPRPARGPKRRRPRR